MAPISRQVRSALSRSQLGVMSTPCPLAQSIAYKAQTAGNTMLSVTLCLNTISPANLLLTGKHIMLLLHVEAVGHLDGAHLSTIDMPCTLASCFDWYQSEA